MDVRTDFQQTVRELIIRRARLSLLLAMVLDVIYLVLESSFFTAHQSTYVTIKTGLIFLLAASIPFTYWPFFQKSPHIYAAILFGVHLATDCMIFALSGCNASYISSFTLSLIFLSIVFPYNRVLLIWLSVGVMAGFNAAIFWVHSHPLLQPAQPLDAVFVFNQNFFLMTVGVLVCIKGSIEEHLKYNEFLSQRDLEGSIQELQQAQAGLVHAEKMASLGRFVAGIAHELNNPINVVYGNLKPLEKHLSTLEKDGSVEQRPIFSDARKILSSLREGSLRMRDLVRDLKIFSHAGQVPEAEGEGAAERFDVHDTLERNIEMLKHFGAKEVRFERQYTALPKLTGKRQHFDQVVFNLLLNALDALPEGHGTIVVTTWPVMQAGQRAPSAAAVRIQDSGCGIKPEALPHIFEPFFTTKPVGHGTGLGLSICHSLIRKMGGSITVDSNLGRGSQFTLTLPLGGTA